MEIFKEGIAISDDALFFAESTYGISSSEEFSAILTDNSFDDREVLLGFIFFPDNSIRLIMEPAIGLSTFCLGDERAIVTYICQKIDKVKLCFPEGTDFLYEDSVETMIEHFIKKLYLCRPLDPKICSALDKSQLESVSNDAKVLLRCSRDPLSERAIDFLCDFIHKTVILDDQFIAYFEMMLSLLNQMNEDTAIEICLHGIRRMYESMLTRIREFEKRKNRYTMEYLILNRFPVPHESEETAKIKLAMLDTIMNDILCLQPRSKPMDRKHECQN